MAKDVHWDLLTADQQTEYRLHIMLSEIAFESDNPESALDHLLKALNIHFSPKYFHWTVKLISLLNASKRNQYQRALSKIIVFYRTRMNPDGQIAENLTRSAKQSRKQKPVSSSLKMSAQPKADIAQDDVPTTDSVPIEQNEPSSGEAIDSMMLPNEPADSNLTYNINNQDNVIDKDKLNDLMDSLMDY